MGTIAELAVPTTEFALHQTLETVPDAEVEVERVAAHGEGQLMPFLWVRTEDFEAFEVALAEDPSLADVECLSTFETERLYRTRWVDSPDCVRAVLENDSTILSATGSEECWRLRILFPDRDALSRTYEFCEENDLSIDIQRIYNVDRGKQGRFGLTDEQEETIAAAYEYGYYDVPR
ncbi:MAG: bacterio-opsin activator domain-containing protein, partial [Halalkalicoccus sp.]